MNLYRSGPRPCPYLPDRESQVLFFEPPACGPVAYASLLDQNFRRSGTMLYRPVCEGCQACQQLRVPVADFRPTKSQERSRRKNTDVVIEVVSQIDDPEALELYCRFVEGRHGQTASSPEDAYLFLGKTVTASFLMKYWVGERLVGAGWIDRAGNGLSSVYFAFDPEEHRRSLGVFSVLSEIDYAQKLGLDWLYLGYWVQGASTMEYKANYRPHQILVEAQWEDRD